ncbi:MAG: hypothetical protein ACK53Y_25355, partial [bacterium]
IYIVFKIELFVVHVKLWISLFYNHYLTKVYCSILKNVFNNITITSKNFKNMANVVVIITVVIEELV